MTPTTGCGAAPQLGAQADAATAGSARLSAFAPCVVDGARLLEVERPAVGIGFCPNRRPQRAPLLAVVRREGQLNFEVLDPLESGVCLALTNAAGRLLHAASLLTLPARRLFNRTLRVRCCEAGALGSRKPPSAMDAGRRGARSGVCRRVQITTTPTANLIESSGRWPRTLQNSIGETR